MMNKIGKRKESFGNGKKLEIDEKIYYDDFILNKTHKPKPSFEYYHLYGYKKHNKNLSSPDLNADLKKVINISTDMKDGIPYLNVNFTVFVFYYF